MVFYPNCKINIGLRVVRKREDGYHDLETIFYPVYGLHDELEVNRVSGIGNRESGVGFSFIQEGLAVDCPAEDNLIIKCYQRMQAKYPKIGDVRIRFKKNIPFAEVYSRKGKRKGDPENKKRNIPQEENLRHLKSPAFPKSTSK